MAKRGKREFVQVLRLLEVFRLEDVLAGVREAIARVVIGFDAVKHLVLCRIERRPPRLDLTVYPYLPRATVAVTSAKASVDFSPASRRERHPQLLLALTHIKKITLGNQISRYEFAAHIAKLPVNFNLCP